jgi:hypothetical protein
MLAEKFFLVLETLLSRADPDGCPRVVSASLQVPIKLPAQKRQVAPRGFWRGPEVAPN